MKFTLPDEWRKEIEKHGTPLYIDAPGRPRAYVLLQFINEFNTLDKTYYTHIEQVPFYGTGKTEKKAIKDLMEIFRLHMKGTKYMEQRPQRLKKIRSIVDQASGWRRVYKDLSHSEVERIRISIFRHGPSKNLISLEQTSEVAPAQWEGRTSDDRPVYIRHRHDVLSVRLGEPGQSIMDAVGNRNYVFKKVIKGDVDTQRMIQILSDILDFRMIEKSNT